MPCQSFLAGSSSPDRWVGDPDLFRKFELIKRIHHFFFLLPQPLADLE